MMDKDTTPRIDVAGLGLPTRPTAGKIDNRRYPRVPVRLQVRFGSAVDFVAEYAENLCDGGVFVRGAHRLDLHDEVDVELSLPGYGIWQIRGRVAHIVSPEEAVRQGRRPGAGLEIIDELPLFRSVVREYLRRLGRRRDVAVVAQAGPPLELLGKAGYRVVELPSPDRLLLALSHCRHPVIAIVMTRARSATYRSVTKAAGISDMMRLFDYVEELDELLDALDCLL